MADILGVGSVQEFLDLMSDTVTVYAYTGFASGSGATYSSTGTSYTCHINMKNHVIVTHDGREVTARGRIVFGSVAVIDVKDKIVLPSEYTPVDPPILGVNISNDEFGAHHTTIDIG